MNYSYNHISYAGRVLLDLIIFICCYIQNIHYISYVAIRYKIFDLAFNGLVNDF